ncbi:MAG: hypothetical protein FJ263_05040 [Planctomycetes bacterium]|nr:hypothetical protein [Planctomycetota bacterium]
MNKFIQFFKRSYAGGIPAGRKTKFHFSAILFLLILGVPAWAAPVSPEHAGKAGKQFLSHRNHFARLSKTNAPAAAKSKKQVRDVAPLQKDDATIGYLVQLEPQGYILMSADDHAPPVKLYSEDSSFEQLPLGFRAVIETELREDLAWLSLMSGQETEFHRQWDSLLGTEPNTVQLASPDTVLLTTSWNQGNPYNYYCPAASGGPDGRAWAGCGATAMAQILRYHYWPVAVTADHSYYDGAGSCTGTYSISDAGMGNYDWANMPVSISSSSTTAQKQAVGQLIYHCAVATYSDFEYNGTGAYPDDVPDALRNYFDYTCNDYVSKSGYTESAWYSKIATDIDAGRPVFYAMWEANGGNGHAVVCDGYRNGNEMHLNLGWSGSGTLWYSLSSVSYGGYTWTTHGAVFNITPISRGSLHITLSPQGAIDSGAKWRRMGTTTWFNSGDTETGIQAGSYTVEFKKAFGWATPANTAVSITKDQTMEIAAVYTSLPEITIGTGTSTDYYPLRTSYHDVRTQTIYPASEIGGACTLYSLALNVGTVPGQAMNNFTIRMKHTDLSVYGSSPNWESTGWTIVYQANQSITTTGWVEFIFSTPFEYNGTQNLMVDISFNNSSSTSDGTCRYTSLGTYRSIYYRTNSGYGDPLTWASRTPTPYRTTNVPNIRLTIASKTADLTGDGFVNMADFAVLGPWWQSGCDVTNDWCDGADIDWSGQSDLLDLEEFVSYWLEGA